MNLDRLARLIAPEGRYVYSNVEYLHIQAPAGRQVYKFVFGRFTDDDS